MHICFVVEGYPTPTDPFMPFVRELIAKMAVKGVKCSVIAPQSITRAKRHRLPVRPKFWRDRAADGVYIDVYQPHYFTLSGFAKRLSQNGMARAANRAFKKLEKSPNFLYAHFWHMGVTASKIKCGLPIFVACGESKISVRSDYSEKETDALLNRLAGVVYVGTKSYRESCAEKLQRENPYIIAPNGYDPAVFYKRDKAQCRKVLNLPQDAFIACFVGSFNHRKGSLRLSAALDDVNSDGADKKVSSVFLGSGTDAPRCGNILFCGKCAHGDIPLYLGAADMFVLPTLSEGCCNAIVEALACGLPVISSNGLFNADIIDETCSLKIDTKDVSAISAAVRTLRDNDSLREKLSRGALKKAEALRLDNRADKIIEFIRKEGGKTL